MKIGFVVNDVLTESSTYTTTRLAMTATLLRSACAAVIRVNSPAGGRRRASAAHSRSTSR